MTDPRLLIASHIKPWKDSTNEERLDVNNGLPLCLNHDTLFDKHLISFDADGKIVVSDTLKEIDRVFKNVNLKIKIDVRQSVYFKVHRNCLK